MDAVLAALETQIDEPIEAKPMPDDTVVPSDAEILDKGGNQRWPEKLSDEALYGLAGDIVNTIGPQTESDPAALLIQFLCSFGNAAGRNAYYKVGAARHYPNLYCVMVGDSSKGRKGTSGSDIRRLFREADEPWTTNCNKNGLSSGEGLIWAVRDPIEKKEAVKEKGRVVDYQTIIEDQGIEDKRLLITESEFASTLRVLGRDGNTLSPVLRNGWDDGDLRILTKNSSAQATNAHISLIGHITADELRRYLDSTEAANGFANRFLWAYVRRSKYLPFGGHIQDDVLQAIIRKLKGSLNFARQAGQVQFDNEARAIWNEVYRELSEGQPGLLGAVTGRSEAQTVRLALIYALLDSSTFIRKEHLWAALSVWEYCHESADCIFGDALGDPIADEIMASLRQKPQGMARTDISALFGRNRTATQIGRALSTLLKKKKVQRQDVETGGRTAEVWVATRGEVVP
jgi:hypothetical protein